MAISELFSASFLFSIAIIIILIGGIFAYVSYRMSEQDHKLNSMLGLISAMAEESQFFRSKLNMLQQQNNQYQEQLEQKQSIPIIDKIQYASQMMGGELSSNLINVSDDESNSDINDDDDNDDDESNSNESNSDINDDDDDDDESNSDESNSDDSLNENEKDKNDYENENENKNIKILELSLENTDLENDNSFEDITENISIEEIKTVHLEDPINLETSDLNINENNMNFLKNVSITDLGDMEDSHISSKSEYKKMSLNKLRDVVISKGLLSDASKLKKNEILKLLGEE